MQFPSKIKFISFEPLLERIDMDGAQLQIDRIRGRAIVDWVIVGGESGRKKRPFDVQWAREIRDVCKRLGIAFFMKQIDKVQEIPSDLMIREYPITFNHKYKEK